MVQQQMRYTEARMTKITLELLRDINKDTNTLLITMMVMKVACQLVPFYSLVVSQWCIRHCGGMTSSSTT